MVLLMLMISAVLVIVGLCMGSFVNALVWRLHAKRNWVSERSECAHCHHKLAFGDLLPVLSWLALRGKCRYCHKKIDDNPLVELLMPILFVGSYAFWPYGFNGVGLVRFGFWLVFLVGFMALAVYDLRWMLLPNKLVYGLIGLAGLQVLLVSILAHDFGVLGGAFIGAVCLGGLFYLLFQLSAGHWIGGGDVKLGIVLGLLAGGAVSSFLVLFMASCLGTLVALPQMAKGKLKTTSRIPFGPFLLVSTVLVYIFGAALINWYKNRFLAL